MGHILSLSGKEKFFMTLVKIIKEGYLRARDNCKRGCAVGCRDQAQLPRQQRQVEIDSQGVRWGQ